MKKYIFIFLIAFITTNAMALTDAQKAKRQQYIQYKMKELNMDFTGADGDRSGAGRCVEIPDVGTELETEILVASGRQFRRIVGRANGRVRSGTIKDRDGALAIVVALRLRARDRQLEVAGAICKA